MVTFTRERRAYLDVLLSYADAGPMRAHAAALSFFGRRQLERRIKSLVGEVNMSRLHKMTTVLGTLALSAGASGVAGYSFPIALSMSTVQPASAPARAGADSLAMPGVVARAPIAYPKSLEGLPVDGRVTVRLVIDDTGAVSTATVVGAGVSWATDGRPANELQGTPDAIESLARTHGLDAKTTAEVVQAMGESAIEALRSWKFEPPRLSPLSFDITVSFARSNVARSEEWTPLVEPSSSDKLAVSVASGAAPDGSGARTGSADTKPVVPGGTVEKPRLMHEVPAAYPADAKAAGVQGSVELKVTIGVDGRISEARVARSVPQLDRAALDAVRQWRFSPGLLNGVPVPVLVTLSVRFSLK